MLLFSLSETEPKREEEKEEETEDMEASRKREVETTQAQKLSPASETTVLYVDSDQEPSEERIPYKP